MHKREMKKHFKKMYPKCSSIEIDNLVSAIAAHKYWKVHPMKNDALYVVSLTQAKIALNEGFKAETTAPTIVVVSPQAARFCRRGRILLVKQRKGTSISDTVLEWPVFTKLIRSDQNQIYQFFVENPHPPAFVNSRILKKVRMLLRNS